MSRSSAREAQVEVLPALVAVVVVCLAVGAYATVRADALPGVNEDAPADAVLADAVDEATPADAVVVEPGRLDAAAVAPSGYAVAVTVTAGDREWAAGPESPPPDAATASTRVPVRTGAGHVHPGRLTVEVWS
jgi:hypothetical protein